MRKYAVINIETGEVINIRTLYEITTNWQDGAIIQNRLVKEIPLDSDNTEYLDRKVFRNDVWEAKPDRPTERHRWTADGWVEVINEVDEWASIRSQRSWLLQQSDWTQMADSPLTETQKTDWRTYRQALRDIPTAQASVQRYEDIVWPTEPT